MLYRKLRTVNCKHSYVLFLKNPNFCVNLIKVKNLQAVIAIMCFTALTATGLFEVQAQREEDINRAIREVDRSYEEEAVKKAGLYTQSPTIEIEINDKPVWEEGMVSDEGPTDEGAVPKEKTVKRFPWFRNRNGLK